MQIRCLYEGVDPHDMLLSWHAMLPDYMQRWQLNRAEVRRSKGCRGRTAVRVGPFRELGYDESRWLCACLSACE